MLTKHQQIWIGSTTGFLILLIVTHIFYTDPLFDASIDAILDLQKDSTESGRYSMETISLLFGGEGLLFIIMILMIVWTSRARAFYYILMSMIAIWVTSIGKLAYHHPRPYMVKAEIQVFGCSTEYGDPSGHSLTSSAGLFTILLDFLDVFKAKAPNYLKYIMTFLAASLVFMVGFSRLYNGDHSMDQILYGWALGVWIALLMNFVVKEPLIDHINTLIYLPDQVPKTSYRIYTVVSSAIFFVPLILVFVAFEILYNTFDIPEEWTKNLNDDCGDVGIFSFTASSLIESGALGLAYFGYLGILYQSKYMGGRKWEYGDKYWQRGTRLVIFLVVGGVIMIPMLLQDLFTSIAVAFFFCLLVPTSILGAFTFTYLDNLFAVCKLSEIRDETYKPYDQTKAKVMIQKAQIGYSQPLVNNTERGSLTSTRQNDH